MWFAYNLWWTHWLWTMHICLTYRKRIFDQTLPKICSRVYMNLFSENPNQGICTSFSFFLCWMKSNSNENWIGNVLMIKSRGNTLIRKYLWSFYGKYKNECDFNRKNIFFSILYATIDNISLSDLLVFRNLIWPSVLSILSVKSCCRGFYEAKMYGSPNPLDLFKFTLLMLAILSALFCT